MKFQFRTPKLIFERGAIEKVPLLCRGFGRKGLVIHGTSLKVNSTRFSGFIAGIEDNQLELIDLTREPGEPTVQDVDNLVIRAKEEGIDWIVGIGGGSAIDLSKAVAGLLGNDGSATLYHDGKILEKRGIPFIAVPTTAGTGAEITNNSVLIDRERGMKKSIRGDGMLPRVAVLDPELTTTMPPRVTANTGMDALTQAIESYISKASNPISDLLAFEAMKKIFVNLPLVFVDGRDIEAREAMLYGSMLSALSFSNAKLGAVHGFAHPIGVQHDLPHGLVCGVLLPHVMKFNLEGNIPGVQEKFARIYRELLAPLNRTAREREKEVTDAEATIAHVFSLLERLEMPRTISGLGIGESDIPAIVADTKGSSLSNNPRETNKDSLSGILHGAL
ncbi:MAG: iron-containing alcohol dehydrogenase [Promethearchaeota archaeon]